MKYGQCKSTRQSENKTQKDAIQSKRPNSENQTYQKHAPHQNTDCEPINSRKVFVGNYFHNNPESFSEINDNISMDLLNHHNEHHINKYGAYIKIGINS